MSIQLSISLLISDRPDTAGKCLASLKPLLRELDSELIVVFTGNNKDILELIHQYTSHIIPFSWCNDFSKARNAGLKEAKGEWFLYLDDDEWFEDTEEIIQFFKSGEDKHYQSALYIQRNYSDWGGTQYSDSHVGRMCRLTPGTKFVYPIHENLNPFLEPYKYFHAYVHHFGYIEKNVDGKKTRKNSRNLPLLLDSYKKKPFAQCCMQIVQEYTTMMDYNKAASYCREGLHLAAKEGTQIESYELWMQANLPFLVSSAGELKSALKEGETLLASPRTLEVSKAHLYASLANICKDLNEPQKGLDYIQQYHQTMEYLRRHPEKADRQKCLSITFSDAENASAETYITGLSFAADTENPALLKEILTWVPWDEVSQILPHYCRLEEWKQNYSAQTDVILEGYFRLKTDNVYVSFQKSLYAARQGMHSEAESYWQKCVGSCPDELQSYLTEAAVNNGFSLKSLLENISLESWTKCVDELAERIDISDMPEFYQRILPELKAYPLCIERLCQRFLEKQLNHGYLEDSKLQELLNQYCESVIAEAKTLYREEILNDLDSYALPPVYKFAFLTWDILCFIPKGTPYGHPAVSQGIENGNLTECISLLKKAVHVYPQMSAVIGRLTRQLDKQTNRPQQTVSDEFLILANQVKQVLSGLIASKQWNEAYGVVIQLITLLPDDLEVLRLKQEILSNM